MNESFCIIIPAYKPGEGFAEFIKEIRQNTSCPIIVIDDGSGEEYKDIFEIAVKTSECCLISYVPNKGKGYALKEGFKAFLEKYASDPNFKGVVTADADGQHLLEDILKIGSDLDSEQDKLILGVRRFKKDVPARSKFGNNVTKLVYRIAGGNKITDTQTGLRGIPTGFLKNIIQLEGFRYEYEMNMLLSLKSLNMGVKEIPIETVYIDNNSGSHFKTFRDSYIIYKLILKKAYAFKYVLSSAASFLIDYLIYALILLIPLIDTQIKFAQVIARIFSSVFNFAFNKKFVFNNKDKSVKAYVMQSLSYFMLVIVNLFLSIELNHILIGWGVNKYISQPIANLFIFIISYTVQKYLIFKKS